MLVDWFTIAAQFVNFVVLVLILRYFLYARILKTVEDREQEIRSRLDDAEREKSETARRAEEQDQREREWENERGERLAQAKEEAEKKKQELVERAREEVEELRTRWHKTLRSDKASFVQHLREGIAERSVEIAREALVNLADEELERHVLRVFRKRLRELGAERREELKQAVDASKESVTVVSAFEIGQKERNELSREIGEAVNRELNVQFETSPDVVCGVELVTDGHKVGFSLGGHLSRVEEWVEEALEAETREQREDSSV